MENTLSKLQYSFYTANICLCKEYLLSLNTNLINNNLLLHYLSMGSSIHTQSLNLSSFIELADILYSYNIDINKKDNNGDTPFHLAIGNGSPLFIYWLLSKGALNLPNNNNITPLDLAINNINNDKIKDKKIKRKRADGVVLLAGKTGLLTFLPKENFHCPDRFSLRSALMMALLSKLIYKGSNNSINGEGNEIIRCYLERWKLKSRTLIEKDDARGIHVETINKPLISIIALRGTKTKKDILTDLNAIKGGSKHSGFQNHLNKILNPLIANLNKYDNSPIYITGHSLGGAMATLLMLKLYKLGFSPNRLYLYTFGQPRAGTKVFQQEFDNLFKNAYIIQRYLDPIPLVPTFSGYVVGGYVHSGSLRYFDASGQLYNDVHYQYEDINRGVMSEIPKNSKPSLNELRNIWTQGFQQLNQVNIVEEETSSIHNFVSNSGSGSRRSRRQSSSNIPKKEVPRKGSNFLSSLIKGRANALAAHGMFGYLVDIARLEGRVNIPFSWDNPEEAITSQLTKISLPLDVYDIDIKGNRYKEEQEQAYLHWIKYYTNIPIHGYSINPSCKELIIPWITHESMVLYQISQIEDAIINQYPSIIKDTSLPKTFHKRNISPLVEVGMYSIIKLLGNILGINRRIGMSYYRWLYWSLPDNGYSIKKQNPNKNIYIIIYEEESPYRRGLRNCMLHLSRNNSILPLERMAHSLPQIVQAGNGLQIAKLSRSIQKMRPEWLREMNEAKLQLVQIQYEILGELMTKFKDVGKKIGMLCVASSAVGTMAGVASGVATGVTVATLSGGSATPVAIAAGIAVGSTVGIGTTGIIAGGIAYKKLPKYLDTIRTTLIELQNHLIGVCNTNKQIQEKHEKTLQKLFQSHKSRGRITIHFINGLYINSAIIKLKKMGRIHPQTLLYENMEIDIEKTHKQILIFFQKILILICIHIVPFQLNEDKHKSYIDVLNNLVICIEENVSIYEPLLYKLGTELSIEKPTIGIQVYKKQENLQKCINHLNNLLANELTPNTTTLVKK